MDTQALLESVQKRLAWMIQNESALISASRRNHNPTLTKDLAHEIRACRVLRGEIRRALDPNAAPIVEVVAGALPRNGLPTERVLIDGIPVGIIAKTARYRFAMDEAPIPGCYDYTAMTLGGQPQEITGLSSAEDATARLVALAQTRAAA